jgi:hypothetical protein
VHHYTYSPAVNALVIAVLLLFAATLAVIVRDRLRLRRLAIADAESNAEHERDLAEQRERDASEAAAGRKPVACWVCGGEFYAPADDPGDDQGRFNCESANCRDAA